jgi:uncharacterized protein (TIGR02996 family)
MIEDAFLAAILEDPAADMPRLVYADWLEERSDPRAEFLRVECALLKLSPDDERLPALQKRLRELQQALDAGWKSLVRRLPLDPLDELRQVLLPPRRPFQASGDWAAVEAALGAALPADYKALVNAYGSGTINSCLEVVSPFYPGLDIREWWTNWARFYTDIAEFEDIPYPVFPEAGGLLPFGTLGDVDILNWRTVGEPHDWPFVYYDREQGFFEIKGLSAVEFLLEVVTQRSPLLLRLGHETAFDPPCYFEPHVPDPQRIQLLCPQELAIENVAEALATRWPPDQVRIRWWPSGLTLLIEQLAGRVHLSHEGGPHTWAWISYDGSCAGEAVGVADELRRLGFG